jgi:hypothetical protein
MPELAKVLGSRPTGASGRPQWALIAIRSHRFEAYGNRPLLEVIDPIASSGPDELSTNRNAQQLSLAQLIPSRVQSGTHPRPVSTASSLDRESRLLWKRLGLLGIGRL